MQGRVLVTSGPTRAWIDRIRYIANTSSGALGKTITETLADAGFDVVHIYGAGSMHAGSGQYGSVEQVEIGTVDDLTAAVERICSSGGIRAVVHAMAVLDYQPESRLEEKKKSVDGEWNIRLVRTPKITPIIKKLAPDARFIGFKLESKVTDDELIRRAKESLEKYGLDAVVANDLEKVSPDRHEAVVIGKDGEIIGRASTKREIADIVKSIIIVSP